MVVALADIGERESRYLGLRMTADEYFRLEDDGFRYELVDGVVCMSPSPTPKHQNLLLDIASQIHSYLQSHPVGYAFVEVDVHLGRGPNGGDLVYRPDVVFIRAEPSSPIPDRVGHPPDAVVEIVSGLSRRYDAETKRGDYERYGVGEYWLIDPDRRTMTFYRLQQGRYVEIAPEGDAFRSEAVPGFVLDLARIRKAFR